MLTHQTFVASLADAEDLKKHDAFIEAHIKRGELSPLRDMFNAILEQYTLDPNEWAPRAACERILEKLAFTKGYENAAAAIELAGAVENKNQACTSRLRVASVVARLVAAQSPQVIRQLLERAGEIEATALILHEAVVRKKLPPESTAAQGAAARLTSQQHRLAVLPLSLLEIETELLLVNYDSAGGQSMSMPYGPLHPQLASAAATQAVEVQATETTTPERAQQIAAAVQNWIDESNGQIEARTFHVKEPGLSSGIAPMLQQLGLACLGPSDTTVFQDDQSAQSIFTLLFSAASSGGAYNSGAFAAYGRLAAWRSLGGLVGCASDASIEEIAARAAACSWCVFSPSNEWFYQVAWDVGIACAAPGRNEVAILAATDTD